MFRFIIAALAIVLYLSIGSITLIYFKNMKNTVKRDWQVLKLTQKVFRFLLLLTGTRLVIEGQENIPEDETVMFVGNHRSMFDIIIGYTLVKRPTGFVAKMELHKFITLRIWMEMVGCLFIDRDDMRQSMQVILDAIQNIKRGISIYIYPEGTRSKSKNPAELLPFKEGSFKIAEKSGCRIVPIAMLGTADVWEAHFPRVKARTVYIKVGTPIDPRQLPPEYKKHVGSYTREQIIGYIEEMQEKYQQLD